MRWFHSGGIFASLSETTADLIIEGMQAARKHGAVVSFDLNYREKLWSASGGAKRAVAVLGRIVQHVDVLVGNEEDLQKGLGIAGPEVAATSSARSEHVRRHDRSRGRLNIRRSRSWPPRCARSTRPPATPGARWRGSTATTYVAPTCDIDVYDRVGGGDGFASGLFYGLLTGETPGNIG